MLALAHHSIALSLSFSVFTRTHPSSSASHPSACDPRTSPSTLLHRHHMPLTLLSSPLNRPRPTRTASGPRGYA
eukprot:928684-Rhodomonas_salina.2